MKDPAKTLKIFSVIILVFSILGILLGIMSIVGGGAVTAVSGDSSVSEALESNTELASGVDAVNDALDTDMSANELTALSGMFVMALGVILIIRGIWGIIMFVMGNKAAKGGPANGAFVVGIIAVVLAVISIAVSLMSSGSGITSGIINLIFYGIYTYCAKLLKDGAAEQ